MAIPTLVCSKPDPSEQVTSYEVFQDGVSIGTFPVSASPSYGVEIDLSGISPGSYAFTLKAINVWGQSVESDPFQSPAAPSKPSGVAMIAI